MSHCSNGGLKGGSRPVSRVLCEPPRGSRQSFLWAGNCSPALATYPQASAEPASVACLFGVAPDGGCRVSPPGCYTEDSSLWPCSSRRRARELPCIPLCGARTFLCAAQLPRHSGCLADSRRDSTPRVGRP